MEKHREAYREEAFELLGELESALLELEITPDDAELIGRVFRSLHTIKGSGAMFGFDNIAGFTHEIETVYDLVRDDRLRVDKQLVDLSLAACDLIRKMVEGADVDTDTAASLVNAFKEMLPEADHPAPAAGGGPGRAERDGGDRVTYRIRFQPDEDLFTTGTNPLLLIDELRELGDCHAVAHIGDIPPLEMMNPEACYIHWDVILTTDLGENAVRDVFIFVEDSCELSIEVIDTDDRMESEDYHRLGEILLARGDVTAETLTKALSGQKRVGEILVESRAIDRDTLQAALAEQDHVRRADQARQEVTAAATIRVAAQKLDVLVDLVGELVTVQANLSRKAALENDSELVSIAEEVERLTDSLRDNAMSIRMLPIGSTFRRFRRLVRDLAGELGKEVIMTTSGGETEMDKTVIEQLNDPLVHIIRNEIDHGIESPETRVRLGKPRQGTVHLAAEHSGANVLIRISGDGAGLDTDAIRVRAVERGLVSDGAELTEAEIHALICAPGFTTAAAVTDVSGRGVGMDVVRRRIEALHGTVDVDSRRGEGTTITLNLPLTLAIIDGLLVKTGPGYFVLPLPSVEECVEMHRREADRSRDRGLMTYRGRRILYVSLRELFSVGDTPPAIERVVISEIKGEKVGFGLDEVIGQHQTVIKPLGRMYNDVKGVSGATILGDGTVALILDVLQLLEALESEARQRAEAPHGDGKRTIQTEEGSQRP